MPGTATVFVIDCGTTTGHQQRELELPRESVSFFGVDPNGAAHATYLPIGLSNDGSTYLRLIYRKKNGMWRIEFTAAVPEIQAGIIPDAIVDGKKNRRSDQAAVFTKVGDEEDAQYELRFLECESDEYKAILMKADAEGEKKYTGDPGGRFYGWF